MSINDPGYSPDPYAHAVRHLDAAEDAAEIKLRPGDGPLLDALLGIGWALLAVAAQGYHADEASTVTLDPEEPSAK